MVSQAMATPAVTKRLEFRVPRFAPSSPFTATTLSTPTDNPISLDRGTSETDANRSASPSLGSSSSSSDSGEVKLAAAVRAQALPSRTDADELALSESENESVSLTVKKPLLAAPGGGASTSSNSTTSDHVITIGDDEGSLSQNASTGGSSALRNMSSNARHELQTRQVAAMEARARAERELAALHSEQTLAGALTRQSLSELKEMLAKGVDPDQKDASGEHSALHYAVYRVALPFAEALLDAKANVDIRNSRGETPLMWAVKTGSLKAVRLLHSRGADIHAQDNDGLTALHHTATMGHILVADFLLQHGHPLDIVDKKMKSAIFYAAWHDHRSFVEWLVRININIIIIIIIMTFHDICLPYLCILTTLSLISLLYPLHHSSYLSPVISHYLVFLSASSLVPCSLPNFVSLVLVDPSPPLCLLLWLFSS